MSKKETTKAPEKNRRVFRKGFILGILFLAVCLFGMDRVMEPFCDPAFCIKCHEMEEVHKGWEQSAHYTNPSGVKVTCVACHLPPKENFISFVCAKTWAGVRETCAHFFSEYDTESARQKALAALPNKRCVQCHDNLLGDPSSEAVGVVHSMSLDHPENRGYACVVCHDNLHRAHGESEAVVKEYKPTDNSYCHVCHINFETEPLAVAHVKVGIGCDHCHGESLEHADDEDNDTPPDIMVAKAQINESCMNADCHPRTTLEKQAGHRPFFAEVDNRNKYCTDCHGQHRLDERQRRWDKATRKLIEREGFRVD